MANNVLRSKLNEVKVNKCYAIMCDEYTDMSNKEQLSFCIRWIDSMLNETHVRILWDIMKYQILRATLL